MTKLKENIWPPKSDDSWRKYGADPVSRPLLTPTGGAGLSDVLRVRSKVLSKRPVHHILHGKHMLGSVEGHELMKLLWLPSF